MKLLDLTRQPTEAQKAAQRRKEVAELKEAKSKRHEVFRTAKHKLYREAQKKVDAIWEQYHKDIGNIK